jgi:DNA polymerase-1
MKLILDFNNLYARAYHAYKSEGGDSFAVAGFVNILLTLIENWNPLELFICVDDPNPTFRHKLYPDYKGTRSKKEDDYIPQLDKVLNVLIQAGFWVEWKEGYEADDLIANIVKSHSGEHYIVSNDKDLMQLVGPETFLIRPLRNIKHAELWNTETVYENYGIFPSQVPDYLAMVGDSSDNIPGIKGIGPKIAQKLLQDWNSLNNIYDSIERIEPRRVQLMLHQNKDDAYLYKQLTTLNPPMFMIGTGDYEVKRLHNVMRGL